MIAVQWQPDEAAIHRDRLANSPLWGGVSALGNRTAAAAQAGAGESTSSVRGIEHLEDSRDRGIEGSRDGGIEESRNRGIEECEQRHHQPE